MRGEEEEGRRNLLLRPRSRTMSAWPYLLAVPKKKCRKTLILLDTRPSLVLPGPAQRPTGELGLACGQSS